MSTKTFGIKRLWNEKSKHAMGMFITLASGLVVYSLGLVIPRGPITYGLSLIPLGIIAATAIARADAIGKDKVAKRWMVRRAGLAIVAGASIALMIGPLTKHVYPPSWSALMFFWGIALTWLTTPNMPPWWKFITGDYRGKVEDDNTFKRK